MNFLGDVRKICQRKYLICNTWFNVIDSLNKQYSLTSSDFTLATQLKFFPGHGNQLTRTAPLYPHGIVISYLSSGLMIQFRIYGSLMEREISLLLEILGSLFFSGCISWDRFCSLWGGKKSNICIILTIQGAAT